LRTLLRVRAADALFSSTRWQHFSALYWPFCVFTIPDTVQS